MERTLSWLRGVVAWATIPAAPVLTEIRTLYALAVHRVRGRTHKERLESFYQEQAKGYDAFRRRLLLGREQMVRDACARVEGGIWVDMGGGTGANLVMLGDQAVMQFAKIYLVDLCAPLMEVARRRCAERGWHHVEVVEGDATCWEPNEGMGAVDLITFSYSLTMIPDWFAAINHAARLLAPDGLLGVVDFYVARKHPEDGMAAHSWLQRSFWPVWFATDNVHLSADHLPYLRAAFRSCSCIEQTMAAPYVGRVLPAVPYYIFIGTPCP